MPADVQACRVAIAGASSLRGKDLKRMVEVGSFPAAEIRLLDEDIAAGTLTEAGGEPVVVQAVDEDSFERVRFAFFAGSPAFALRHWQDAERAGATVIDLSGGLADVPAAVRWIPALDPVLPPPAAQTPRPSPARLFVSLSAPAILACSLAGALAGFSLARLALVFFQPVSERGAAGIEELESQTIMLLSFQPVGQEVFDAQVAFNLLDRYGQGSSERLSDAHARVARDVCSYLAGRVPVPAIQVIHAPVFYSYAFTAHAELGAPPAPPELRRALGAVEIKSTTAPEDAPSNVSVAGESQIVLGEMERDPGVQQGYWFWGAADNMRLAAANAVRIAEKLLAS